MKWKHKHATIGNAIGLIILMIGDVITTLYIVNHMGGKEFNIFVAPFLDHLVLLKIIALIAITILAICVEKYDSGSSPYVFCGAAIMTGVGFFWNVSQIFGIPIL
jgi:hypothetical protein